MNILFKNTWIILNNHYRVQSTKNLDVFILIVANIDIKLQKNMWHHIDATAPERVNQLSSYHIEIWCSIHINMINYDFLFYNNFRIFVLKIKCTLMEHFIWLIHKKWIKYYHLKCDRKRGKWLDERKYCVN